jgi:hypothetical protein
MTNGVLVLQIASRGMTTSHLPSSDRTLVEASATFQRQRIEASAYSRWRVVKIQLSNYVVWRLRSDRTLVKPLVVEFASLQSNQMTTEVESVGV